MVSGYGRVNGMIIRLHVSTCDKLFAYWRTSPRTDLIYSSFLSKYIYFVSLELAVFLLSVFVVFSLSSPLIVLLKFSFNLYRDFAYL